MGSRGKLNTLVKLRELLGRKVDIVTEHGLHWYLREKIIKEAQLL
jgi:hypothetical protein